MITLKLFCAMCGKEHFQEMNINEQAELDIVALQKRIEDAEDGWELQRNGANLDVYCSEKCAK